MEIATMMAFSLAWWNYLVMALVTFASVWSAYRLENWLEHRKADPGPYPCLTHMGTNTNGMDLWCWQEHGHEGVHTDWWDQEGVREWEAEDAPVAGCPHWESNLYCASVYGHDGPHNLRTA